MVNFSWMLLLAAFTRLLSLRCRISIISNPFGRWRSTIHREHTIWNWNTQSSGCSDESQTFMFAHSSCHRCVLWMDGKGSTRRKKCKFEYHFSVLLLRSLETAESTMMKWNNRETRKYTQFLWITKPCAVDDGVREAKVELLFSRSSLI